jgi:hypothetical protein
VIAKVYGNFGDFGRFWVAKNKANSKPISFQLSDLCWDLKKQSLP